MNLSLYLFVALYLVSVQCWCVIVPVNCVWLAVIRSDGCEDAGGGGAECGPTGPQYHITRGAVPLGCQLLLPEDPEKQPQQQPPLPVQVPGPLPSLCGWVANLFYVMVFGVYHGIRIRSHSVSWNAPSSYHGITISAPWYFLWGNKWLSSVDQFTCFSVPFLLPKTLLWQFVAILLLVNLWLICMNLINMFLYDLLMHNLML